MAMVMIPFTCLIRPRAQHQSIGLRQHQSPRRRLPGLNGDGHRVDEISVAYVPGGGMLDLGDVPATGLILRLLRSEW